MGADACPVPEGEGSWLFWFQEKLTTEAPVNGGCNYDSPKVNCIALVKPNYMLEKPLTASPYSSSSFCTFCAETFIL